MDPLTHLLAGPRAARAFALRMVMDPPWAVDVRDEAPLTLMALRTGAAVLTVDSETVALVPGDVALVRGPGSYLVSDQAGRVADIVINPDQRCTTVDGATVTMAMVHGVRTWGNCADGATTMLVGTYVSTAELGAAVGSVLPRSAVVQAGGTTAALLALLDVEMATDAAGQGATIDRLLDVLLVHTVRSWAADHPTKASGWLAGGQDPVVAGVLEAIHTNPAHPWTLETLAARVHVSRATLAARSAPW